MKRFVSYLYSIYNNQKIHNAGFARIELRTGRNRIDIHLRENGYSGKTGTVYLFIRKQENIQGISIGSLTFRSSQADFRFEQAEENIGQTPWQIMQMHGILIMMDGRAAFLSQWDEQPIDTSRFEVWEPGQPVDKAVEENQTDGQEKNQKEKQNGNQEIQKRNRMNRIEESQEGNYENQESQEGLVNENQERDPSTVQNAAANATRSAVRRGMPFRQNRGNGYSYAAGRQNRGANSNQMVQGMPAAGKEMQAAASPLPETQQAAGSQEPEKQQPSANQRATIESQEPEKQQPSANQRATIGSRQPAAKMLVVEAQPPTVSGPARETQPSTVSRPARETQPSTVSRPAVGTQPSTGQEVKMQQDNFNQCRAIPSQQTVNNNKNAAQQLTGNTGQSVNQTMQMANSTEPDIALIDGNRNAADVDGSDRKGKDEKKDVQNGKAENSSIAEVHPGERKTVMDQIAENAAENKSKVPKDKIQQTQQPGTSSLQPTVSDSQLGTGSCQPAVSDSQPGTGSCQPSVGGNQAPASQNSASVSDICTAELQPQPIQDKKQKWEQTWRYMLRTYPVISQVANKDDILCIRIEIKDVRLLPEKYWSMVNNSFLLHGFFNYHYLAFGRIRQSWFMGVPGIYQNQEHVMASIFGFPDFLPHEQKNDRGEQPGYWYRVLDI